MKMMNQARKMKKTMKKKKVEHSSRDGMITVEAAGDMSIRRVRVDPKAGDLANTKKLESNIRDAVSGALKGAQKAMQSEMGGLSDMFS